MGWFKKNKDVVDLTKLREQGILQRSQEIAQKSEKLQSDNEGVVDLSSSDSSSGNDFLSSLAGVGDVGSVSSEGDTDSSVLNSLRAARQSRTADFGALKNKIEDVEYKLDRFIERLEKIEGKLGD